MSTTKILLFLLVVILFISCHGDKSTENIDVNGEENSDGDEIEISMVTPYVNQTDMASINEAFSTDNSAPWGFEHRGIDFFPNADLRPFRAVSSGVIDVIDLYQLESTSNWQVSVRLIYNATYSVHYAFEPMTPSQTDGEIQLNNILVSVNQSVSQRDTLGYLYAAGNGAHVDFSLFENWEPICPETYFTPAARDSILELIHVVWPGANMCY